MHADHKIIVTRMDFLHVDHFKWSLVILELCDISEVSIALRTAKIGGPDEYGHWLDGTCL